MVNIKVILFIISLFLVTYVGGMPQDSKNFFIVHTIFLTPILLEFWQLTQTKSGWVKKFFIYPIWIAGICVLIVNVIGIMGFINVTMIEENFLLIFDSDYLLFKGLRVDLNLYFILSSITATALFLGNLLFAHKLTKPNTASDPKTANA